MKRRILVSKHPLTSKTTLAALAILTIAVTEANAQIDPGVRPGTPGAGTPIPGLTVKEAKFFDQGLDEFEEVASVAGTIPGTEPGLGPRFNLTSCAGCHAFPAVGGSSPASNPQVTVAPLSQVDPLVTLGIIGANGPVREARFKWVDPLASPRIPDGGVHALFTIMGRSDTPAGCSISQPNFALHNANGSLVFRIPTPVFGLGLIEAIADTTILANEGISKPYGISGHANRNGNDGTVTRFGWKAQNKSLASVAGEAYNVEQGVTNALFPDERGDSGRQDPAACRTNPTSEDHVHYELTQPQTVIDNANAFANFMRFLAPAAAVTSYTSTNVGAVSSASINAGAGLFVSIGCAVCHTVSMPTGSNSSAALSGKTAFLYSDLLVHDVGTADDVSQGNAQGTEFRTAPLWGLGQRIFFLHDGRTSNLVQAITSHGGEAATVIGNYNARTTTEKQNLLNFLRSR